MKRMLLLIFLPEWQGTAARLKSGNLQLYLKTLPLQSILQGLYFDSTLLQRPILIQAFWASNSITGPGKDHSYIFCIEIYRRRLLL